MVFVGIVVGILFHVFIVRYKGDFLNLEVLWDGIVSFPDVNCLVLVMALDLYFEYSSCRFGVLFLVRALWMNTDSWTFLLWFSFKKLSCWKDGVAESCFLFPVMDLTAKFCTL